ncbi:MAG: glycosyltransferase family 2 protein [Anaerolineales bacterium]|nr:glycosyltransferase family 2 protein [Anaerolineales bacterium]
MLNSIASKTLGVLLSTHHYPALPMLSIIIVSWNVCDLLRDCLRSIYDTADNLALTLEIIVIDSASSDNTVAMVQTEFPAVRLQACAENVGFPKGNNIGLEMANGRYLFLLNPDTVVQPGALQTLVAYLEQNTAVGMVAPQLLNDDGTVQSSRRRFPTLATGFWESTWLQPYAPAHILRDYYMTDLPDNTTAEADWVQGAAMLIRREVYEEVGGMDEAYFMYSEELDWCRRIRQAGWPIVYLPPAQVTHYQGKSSEQASTQRHINFNRAKLRYFRKYHGRVSAFALRLFLLLNYAAQLLLEASKALLGHRRDLRQQRIRAYWQVLRSGLRPAGF